ncbi:MAG: GDSL-type esterase/lipase family protein [Bacteroidia bacterium]
MNLPDTKKVARSCKTLFAGLLWLFLACSDLPAQNPPPVGKTVDSLVLAYPYINTSKNIVNNDSAVLDAFYEKLWELKQGKRDRVTVVQIGDSHIQADFFSGKMRQNLQRQFGNAGRGLVFPYRIAKSNEPTSYKTMSTGTWAYKRNVFADQQLPIGLCGFTVQTADTNSSIVLKVYDQPGLNYGFNKISIFHSKGQSSFQLSVCTEFNCMMAMVPREGEKFVSVVSLDSLMHTVMFNFSAPDSLAKDVSLYGMLLENGKAGVQYNMIGVNGAECADYNASAYFMEQLILLKPDLVIVSLGTNEGFPAGFKQADLQLNMNLLISNLQKNLPESKIMMTTPGDSFRKGRKGRVKNPNMTIVRNTIVDYCNTNTLPYWDLYNVMGGYGSMAKWYVSGLAQKDRLHFTRKGYELQADLFYVALMKGYEKYVSQHHNQQ